MTPSPQSTPGSGASASAPAPYVSIILPCYNEQDHVVLEVERISAAMDASGFSYELLVIDDASTDATLERIQGIADKYPALTLIPFRRNGGAGTARRLGTQQAAGEIVVRHGADTPYPNERIPELVRIQIGRAHV